MAGDGAAAPNDGGGEQGQQGGGEQGADYGALTQQLEGLNQSHEQTRDALQSITQWIDSQRGDDGQEQGEPALDLSFLDEQNQYLEPAQLQQQLGDVINQAVEARMQAQLGPMQQQMAEARMEQQARDLVQEYPELGESEVATQVVGLAAQIAEQSFPPEVAKVLKDSPAWWRQVYLSGRGVEAANAEGSESPQTATLEGGGGAAPLAAGQETGSYFGSNEGARGLPF